MKKILLKTMLIISMINICYAQNAVILNKGDIAPFRGGLVKPDRLNELVKAERKNIKLQDLRATQDELIEYHKSDARKQRNKLSDAKFNSFLANTGYFLLGIVLTGVAFKSADAFKGM